jgi:hypothetical protein
MGIFLFLTKLGKVQRACGLGGCALDAKGAKGPSCGGVLGVEAWAHGGLGAPTWEAA